jgi:hypothetical protein
MIKKLGIAVLVLIATFAGALFWLHGNLDGLLRDAISKYGSEMTQAKVSVGGVKINATNGEGIISDLSIQNPKGFKTPYAFKVKEFLVVIEPTTLTDNVVLVKKISIVAPDVIYEKGDSTTNFDALQKNITAYLGPSDEKPSSKKLIVEELTIRNIKAQAAASFMGGKTIAVTLPDVVLHNIGKAKGGISPGELGQVIAGSLKKQLSSSINFNKLSKTIGESTGVAVKSAKDAVGKVLSIF